MFAILGVSLPVSITLRNNGSTLSFSTFRSPLWFQSLKPFESSWQHTSVEIWRYKNCKGFKSITRSHRNICRGFSTVRIVKIACTLYYTHKLDKAFGEVHRKVRWPCQTSTCYHRVSLSFFGSIVGPILSNAIMTLPCRNTSTAVFRRLPYTLEYSLCI